MNHEFGDKDDRLLIVDDNTAIHEDFRKILCPNQSADRDYEHVEADYFGDAMPEAASRVFEVDSAYRGQEALECVKHSLAENRPYSVAFVDVRMPSGWDGVETIVELWKVDPRIQIVICSAYSDYTWYDICRILGKTESLVILKKPFDTVEVVQLAHSLSEKWLLARQVENRLTDLDAMVNSRTLELQSANLRLKKEIAEKTIVETALRHSEERFSKAFAASPLPMAIQTTHDNRYIDVNSAFLKMMGFDRDQAIQHTSLELGIWQNDARRQEVEQVLGLRHAVRDLECSFRTKAGAVRSALMSVEYFNLDCDACALIILHDISDRISLENQLRQSQKMEAVGQLAGGVAHDFNNVLCSMLMQTELVESVEHLPDEAREGLKQIREDANRAANLIRQLLLFSRRQVMQSRNLDLNEIVKNLAKMLQRIIGEDVQLQLHLHPSPLVIHADSGMLDQVLMNLAVNSRDAMTKGGRLRIETTRIVVDENTPLLNPDIVPGYYVSLSVSDTGGGIAPEVLPRIFDPFFTTKEVGKGTGLGLATVFGIVKQHHGWVQVDNHPGQGVCFQILLPATGSTVPESAQFVACSKPRGGKETILLVEDDELVRKPMRLILQRCGYTVMEAANGVEALKLWQEHRQSIALIVTDLIMPAGLSGQELSRQLQKQWPELKVVFISGYSVEIAGRELQLRSGENFVQKPFTSVQLLETVRRCLDG